MADSKMNAKIVRIVCEQGRTGLLFATSPDLKGLLVAERTQDDLDRAIPKAIMDMYEACGINVVVSRVDDDSNEPRSWVAISAEIARRALAEQNGRKAG